MKTIDKIKKQYEKRKWFNRIENGFYKKEYIIYANYYPYTEDEEVLRFAKSMGIKISVKALG
jgi:hypothetical protein